MSNISKIKNAPNVQSVESVIEEIKALLDGAGGLILVGTMDAEVSGVIDDGEEIYREVIPLGDGVHIVFTIDLPTKIGAGIHEV